MSWFSDWTAGGMSKAIGDVADKYQNRMTQILSGLKGEQTAGEQAIRRGTGAGVAFQSPYMRTGGQAMGQLGAAMGLPDTSIPGQPSSGDRFKESPGYQFALSQGLQGVQRNMGAAGMTGSGAEQKALEQYGTGQAEKEYNTYLGQLSGLAGIGSRAAGRAGQMTSGAGSDIARGKLGYTQMGVNLATGLAQALAQAQMEQEESKEKQRGGMVKTIGKAAAVLALLL